MTEEKKIKVALVHDFLTEIGGAERVLAVLCRMFPDAPIYTILYDRQKTMAWFGDRIVHVSFLQRFPEFLRKRRKWLLPFFPVAPETFNLRDYDLVISSSGAWSKGIVTRLNTIHIAYLHSPMRFVWDANGEYLGQQKKGRSINFFVRLLLNYIRVWDMVAADRPDWLLANSDFTKKRIKKYYGRDAKVIFPPVSVDHFGPVIDEKRSGRRGRYFLVVSRLSPYKKIDVIIESFNKLGLPLLVVGTGSQEKYLRKIALDNVRFAGFQPDEKLSRIYADAIGLVSASFEDFGMTAVEAMACGVPVLGIRRGGLQEILLEGETGEFFDAATPEVIADGVRRFKEREAKYDRNLIRRRAEEFGAARFEKELREYVSKIIEEKNKPNGNFGS